MGFSITNRKNEKAYSNQLREKDLSTAELFEDKKRLELPFGNVNIQEWRFDGIRIGHFDWEFSGKSDSEWKGDLDVVHLHFTLKGNFRTRIRDTDKVIKVDAGQHNMFYSSKGSGQISYDDKEFTVFIIQITKDMFLHLTQNANDILKRFGENILEDRITTLAKDCLPIDMGMFSIIHSILNCPYDNSLKKMFLLSKCIEMLVMQAEAYNRSMQQEVKYVKNDYDKERLLFARDYLVQHLDLPPSLTELSRIAGVNEYKLKRGFKELFGTTVFGYVSECRLEMARLSLIEGQKTATEIAFELGYSSLPHFSSAFKKKFGVSPKGMS